MIAKITQEQIIAIERAYCEISLANFIKRAWHVLEPNTQLKWGWALDAICEHLEAITKGHIRNLLINVPPGMMKSLITSVFWPAWEWGAAKKPYLRVLGTSYIKDISTRDSTRMRRLIESDWYQSKWPIQLLGDQNAKTKFENDKTGARESMAFTSLTGSRGDRLIFDDPLSVNAAYSMAELNEAERVFCEALPTRVNNDSSAIIGIMQRLHTKDTSGIILDRKLNYVHLCLPMEYEAARHCRTIIGFSDPRTKDGELLHPERFNADWVANKKIELREYGYAAQMQQLPSAKEGNVFKRQWFKISECLPAGCSFVSGWDIAATENGGDYACRVKIAKDKEGNFYVVDVIRERVSPAQLEKLMLQTAQIDGYNCAISIPQDPGAAGKIVVDHAIKKLSGYAVTSSTETGSKRLRVQAFAAQLEAGNVSLLKGDWNAAYIDELCNFPTGKNDDQVDASSRAFNELALKNNYDWSVYND